MQLVLLPWLLIRLLLPLTYTLRVVGYPDAEAWRYLETVESLSAMQTAYAPSTRNFSVLVTVSNRFGSTTSCPYHAGNDGDSDAICRDIDSCHRDPKNDADSDTVCGDVDTCGYDAENDADGDDTCGNADSCAHDPYDDSDSDAICGDVDSCPNDYNNDIDSDVICDDVDSCNRDE